MSPKDHGVTYPSRRFLRLRQFVRCRMLIKYAARTIRPGQGCYLYLCLILAKPTNGVIPDLLSGKYIGCCNTPV
ncbi:hypothetical protein BDQ94DRAFT_151823 [Aspergillus welwitschiae]|uniref:Uncharacterized protein n=1 Tax=Aspergillus welwitschiae TaxID=1341132 RepID=A0A3F3PNL4_9EURO|nr:hypothetical protein BDQ94DRAFT_151823 [Aspergillus welwitschiae]RDH28540.1 hypothetical protein BDQ94DRAFT_151823 [Aspergillus welwitschiae]